MKKTLWLVMGLAVGLMAAGTIAYVIDPESIQEIMDLIQELIEKITKLLGKGASNTDEF